jgi:hypothetical protein
VGVEEAGRGPQQHEVLEGEAQLVAGPPARHDETVAREATNLGDGEVEHPRDVT